MAPKVYHCVGSGGRSARGNHPAASEGDGLGQGVGQSREGAKGRLRMRLYTSFGVRL